MRVCSMILLILTACSQSWQGTEGGSDAEVDIGDGGINPVVGDGEARAWDDSRPLAPAFEDGGPDDSGTQAGPQGPQIKDGSNPPLKLEAGAEPPVQGDSGTSSSGNSACDDPRELVTPEGLPGCFYTGDGTLPEYYTPMLPMRDEPQHPAVVEYEGVCEDAIDCCAGNATCLERMGQEGCAAVIDSYDCNVPCVRLYGCCRQHPNSSDCGDILIFLEWSSDPEPPAIEIERQCSIDVARLEEVCP